jgi:hypothetical protein
VYLNYLQKQTEEAKNNYKTHRNTAKHKVRMAHQESWEKFINTIEHDVHSRQQIAYKVIKKTLNSTQRDTAQINNIKTEQWTKHYKELWYNPEQPTYIKTEIERRKGEVDPITIEELEEALNKLKNRKAPGPDNLNVELFKYGALYLKQRQLTLLNMCWQDIEIPKPWLKALVISIYKKRDGSNCENYRGIGYKIYAKIINKRLQTISDHYY